MAKDSKCKQLFITILLTVLLVSSAYASIAPIVNAAEQTVQDKTLDILRNVVGFNTESYAIVLHSQLDNQYFNLPQKQADIYLVSEQGGVRATCYFVNNMLRQIYLSDYEGDLAVKQPATATAEMAKGFLQRYQNYAGDTFYGVLSSMLDDVDAMRNTTKSAGNVKLEVLNSDNTIIDYVWTYTDENGIVAKSKNVILSYDRGQLKVFLNNWPLYRVVGMPKISAEEATAIAIEASKKFSYQVTTDNGTVQTVSGFEIVSESLGQAQLSYVNFPNASFAREGDPFTLYPSWYVPLGFDKLYPGYVTGVTVTIWADTSEVSSIYPMIIDYMSVNLAEDETVSQITSTQGLNNLYGPIVIIAMLSLAGISLATKKKPKLACSRKLFSLRLGGILLCALILFSLTLVVTPTVNASAAIPNSKSRIYASMHGQLAQEQQAANWTCDQIRQAFESSGYSTSNHCGAQTTKSNVLNYAQSDEQNYDRVALFHFGHMGIYGFNGGYRDNNNVTISSSDIYAKTTSGKHKFVFIWVCAQAQWNNNGTPVAWTHRDGQPGRPYMNEDGYLQPDGYTHCYIGFENFSPPIGNDTRTFQEQMTLSAKWFIKYFYDYALRDSRSVRDALNLASIDFFQQPYTSSIFRSGYNAWWPGSDEFPPDHPYRYAKWVEGKMKVYGNGAIWLFQPKITLAANYGLSPTFYLDGTPRSPGDVHTWPKTYSVSVSVPAGYTFHHFNYRGGNYGNNPTNIPLYFTGTLTAYYTVGFSDNFNDNSMDTSRWEKLEANGATVNEIDNQLKVTVPSGEGQAQAGYVTKYACNIQGLATTIDITEFDNLDEMALQICTTKTTSSDPFYENNWYRILKARYDSTIYVQRKVNGVLSTQVATTWAGATGSLMISVGDGSIALYENGILRYSENYALPSYTCYIYVFTSTLRSRASGTDSFDNFALYQP